MKEKNYKKLSNIKRMVKNFSIIALACVIVLSNSLIALAETVYQGKEEVVYAMLEANGSIDEMYVVNIFDKDGEIVDYGDYFDIRNMTTNDPVDLDGDTITINNTKGKLYYEGRLKENELPWDIDIKYFMDGKEYDVQNIAGESGSLTIKISIVKNEDCDDVFYENHALQALLLFDTEKVKNIVADDATIANVGSDKQLTYTILPGKGADITINADVTDFEMEAISINGIHLNLDIDLDDEALMEKVDQLLEGVDKLDDGANKLRDGAGEFKDGSDKLVEATKSLQMGSVDLDNGINSLKGGVDQIQNALNELNNKSDSLTNGSAEFKAALIEIQEKISGVSIGIEKLEELSNASSDIKKGIENLNASTKLLKESVGYSQYKVSMKNNGLDIDSLKQGNAEAIGSLTAQVQKLSKTHSEIKDVPGYEKQAAELRGQIDQLNNVVKLLNGNNGAIAGNERYINTVSESISKLDLGVGLLKANYETFDHSIDLMVKTISDVLVDMPKLANAVNTLVERYTLLDKGINDYTDGVARVVVGYRGMADGVWDLNQGSKTLKTGNRLLYQNMFKLSEGSSDLYKGTNDLKEGTEEFKDKTSNIDEEVSDQIDDVLMDLTGDASKITSFTSKENKEIKSVQFVIKTAAIETSNPVELVAKSEKQLSFWEKLKNLFI